MSILGHTSVFAFALIGMFSSVESASLKFYHGSLKNYTSTPMEEPQRLLPFFNKTLVSMFYVFGFNETADSEDATVMLSAYLNTGYTNVVLVDWSDEARAGLGGAILSYALSAVPNTRIVGRSFGGALVTLIEKGISEKTIHLVGHSLGAHLAGYAGEYVKESNFELARITGLDPAGPMFEAFINTAGLIPTRAKFVDVLHTNPYQYGNINSLGSVDFWANCGDTVQPGCSNVTETPENLFSFCSHWRSYLIFSEAIVAPTLIPAVKSVNCITWRTRRNSPQTIYLGDLIDTSARGNFFFSTRSVPPFAKGQGGLVPNN